MRHADEDGSMKALTVYRPFDYWISEGIKPVENRSWRPPSTLPLGSLLAIHAGLKYDVDGEAWIRRNFPHLTWPPKTQPGGGIVAVARLVGILEGEFGEEWWNDRMPDWWDDDKDRPWFLGDVGWVLG